MTGSGDEADDHAAAMFNADKEPNTTPGYAIGAPGRSYNGACSG
jgi:hypothetical protein